MSPLTKISALTDAERAAIVADLRAGEKSQHQIAKDHMRSKATVSKIAKQEGLASVNIHHAKRAREVREAMYQRRRTDVKYAIAERATRIVQRMKLPSVVFHWTKDGEYVEHEFDEPTSSALRNYSVSVKILVEAMTLLDGTDANTGTGAFDRLWERLEVEAAKVAA